MRAMFRSRSPLPLWFAMLALLLYTLMPAISGLFTPPDLRLVQEICTPAGLQLKKALDVPSGKVLATGEHCPWCLSGSHFALPATGPALMPPPVLHQPAGTKRAWTRPDVPLPAWSAPRGPPRPV